MTAIDYRQLALSWQPDNQRNHVFNRIATTFLIVALLAAALMSIIRMPKVERPVRDVVPERVARFVMEKPKPQPKPEVKKALPPPQTEMRIQRPPPSERKPLTKVEEKARKTAEGTGLIALSKELSALADISTVSTQVAKRLNTAPANTVAATVDTKILTSDTGRKSTGVSKDAHVGNVGTTKLDDSQRQATRAMLAASAGAEAGKPGAAGARASASQGVNARRYEDVAVVMDQNKSTLYTLYNRARRNDPGLKGKIVLILTVQPSGQVSNITIKSSELNSPELEASLVARIRQFDFGKRQGGPLTVTVPVEFLPS